MSKQSRNGDPLTGTAFVLTSGGFTYHPQELVFFSWFYPVPATGTGGKFSFEGLFTAAQGSATSINATFLIAKAPGASGAFSQPSVPAMGVDWELTGLCDA